MKRSEVPKVLAMILAVIGLFLYLILGGIYVKRQSKKDFKDFNKAEINGKIVSIGIAHHKAIFKVNNDEQSFIFSPYVDDKLNAGKIFDLFARIGDRVIKHAGSDTLYLIRSEKVYKYTFDRLN